MGTHLDYAQRLFEKGIICLPLRPGGKHLDLARMGYEPVHLHTMRKDLKELAFTAIAFHLAQKPPTHDTITKWFSKFQGNIGILGGAGDLVILDFDSPARYEAWCRKNESIVESAPVAKTPGGYHVFLRMQLPMVSSSMHLGLRRLGHIKSLGGYVVGSPSELSSGARYDWLSHKSLEDIEPYPVASLAGLSLRPVSLFKEAYDRLLGRGFFKAQ